MDSLPAPVVAETTALKVSGDGMSTADHLCHRSNIVKMGASAAVGCAENSLESKTGNGEERGLPNSMKKVRMNFPPPQEQVPVQTSSTPGDKATTSEEEITDQDVLFGRGGLTNHHIGNLRYRDIIELHRHDYIRAPKTEKPNVARRIVKAIRTGPNPGRFLRKDAYGKWQVVDDREATWKASQALREKTRWASMKKDKEGSSGSSDAAFTHCDSMISASLKEMVESATINAVKRAKKRSVIDTEVETEEEMKEVNSDANQNNGIKKAKSETTKSLQKIVPTDASDIAIPPIESSVGEKLLPQINDCTTSYIIPKDEDVLFGRGGRTNHHPGNVRLREIVEQYRHIYAQAKKIDKPNVSKLIVGALRSANPPSRFLRLNEATSRWEDVGDRRAAEKVSQTLREKDRNNPQKDEDGSGPSQPAADPTEETCDETTTLESIDDDAKNSSETALEGDYDDNRVKSPQPKANDAADGVELPYRPESKNYATGHDAKVGDEVKLHGPGETMRIKQQCTIRGE